MIPYIDSIMENEFNTQIEDGSLPQVYSLGTKIIAILFTLAGKSSHLYYYRILCVSQHRINRAHPTPLAGQTAAANVG